jgi:hypothetical protein
MEAFSFSMAIFGFIISFAVLYLIIAGATKSLTRLDLARIQLKVVIEIAKKLGVPESDISKHFTSEKIYNTFSKKKMEA